MRGERNAKEMNVVIVRGKLRMPEGKKQQQQTFGEEADEDGEEAAEEEEEALGDGGSSEVVDRPGTKNEMRKSNAS